MLISPSKIMMYNDCPKKLEFKYIFWIPQKDQDYFQIWKDVEDYLCNVLLQKKEATKIPSKEIIKLANSIYQNRQFQELIKNKDIIYQKEYKTSEIQGFSDIETEDTIIDIKTSSAKWNLDTVKRYKFQAMTYMKYSWKSNFYFVVVNKKTYDVQVLKVNISNFEDLENKIFEIKLAFKMWVFKTNPSFNCKFCDYNEICEK
jgi:CRISPR/Cas system-associated exonuclease Cas4 (RecB family)